MRAAASLEGVSVSLLYHRVARRMPDDGHGHAQPHGAPLQRRAVVHDGMDGRRGRLPHEVLRGGLRKHVWRGRLARVPARQVQRGLQPPLPEVLAPRPQLGQPDPAPRDGPDGQDPQRHRHHLGVLVDVVRRLRAHPVAVEERQVQQPEHVERRHHRRAHAHHEQHLGVQGGELPRAVPRRERLPQDLVLAEEPREPRDPRDGDAPDQEHLGRLRDLRPQLPHLPDVLLPAHGVDHRPRPQEQQTP